MLLSTSSISSFLLDFEFDRSGTLWLLWQIPGLVAKGALEARDTAGNVVAGPFIQENTFCPLASALDSFGQVWIANGGCYPEYYEAPGVTVSKTTGEFSFFVDAYGDGIHGPWCIVADTTVFPNLIWVLGTAVTRIVDDGTPAVTVKFVSANAISFSAVVALDNNGDVWESDGYRSLTKIHNAATPTVAVGPVTVDYQTWGVTSQLLGITTDSANHVWAAMAPNSIAELDTNGNMLSPANGFTGCLSGQVTNHIAVDRSGNVWLMCQNSVTELLGAAAPVATPGTSGRPIAP